MLDANVYHFAAMLKKFIPKLLARSNKSGVIITSSIASFTPLANNSVYHASKTFELAICRAFQSELGSNSKIEMLIACPSYVETALLTDGCKAPSHFIVTTSGTVDATLKCVGQDKETFGALIHEI